MAEVFYGGDGIKERTEYHELQGEALKDRALQATGLLEDVLESGHILDTVTNALSTDRDVMEREMTLSYLVFDKDSDDRMYYDTVKKGFYVFEAKSTSYEKDVVIRHTIRAAADVREEYFVSFERRLPRIEGSFFHTYIFEFMDNGEVRVSVESNNIDVDDGVAGSVYERPMSGYDFAEFCKEISEVADHVTAGHIEQDIDRKLAKHIQ